MHRWPLSSLAAAAGALLVSAGPAAGQPIGIFSWQTAPYCNVVTVNVTQTGSVYTLDGFDSLCGAERRATVTGIATINPNGTIGLGLTIIDTLHGEAMHMDGVIDLATLGGPWSDSGGTSGMLVFNGAGGGSGRPTGQILATKFGNTSLLIGRRANGTPTAPSAIVAGNNLLLIGAQGYDGFGFGFMSARIAMVASESWQSDAHGARIQFMTTVNGGPGAVVRMTLDHDGRLGIGTDTPADLLDVRGDIRIGTGNLGCVRDRNGTIIAGACASDARLKRDVVSFEPMLEKITALRPVHFYWSNGEFPARAFGERQSYGLVAQEVEGVLPELVTSDADGFRAVNYSKLPLLAIQAIKDLKSENDALKAENAELARRLAKIEAHLKLP